MAQITIYLDNNLELKIKELAKSAGVSISKFISKSLEQKVSEKWSNDVKNLSGSWSDFPSIDEIRTLATDLKREEF